MFAEEPKDTFREPSRVWKMSRQKNEGSSQYRLMEDMRNRATVNSVRRLAINLAQPQLISSKLRERQCQRSSGLFFSSNTMDTVSQLNA